MAAEPLDISSSRYLIIGNPSGELKALSNRAIVSGGMGFYAKMESNMLLIPNPKMLIFLDNGTVIEPKGDLILEGRFLVFARRPTFVARQALARGVMAQSLLYPYVARDLVLRGNATFRFVVGDDNLLYFIVDPKDSSVSFETPLDIYSERESAPLVLKHLPWSASLSVLLLCKSSWAFKRFKKFKRPT